jgi:hypothetical protein
MQDLTPLSLFSDLEVELEKLTMDVRNVGFYL